MRGGKRQIYLQDKNKIYIFRESGFVNKYNFVFIFDNDNDNDNDPFYLDLTNKTPRPNSKLIKLIMYFDDFERLITKSIGNSSFKLFTFR